MGNTHVLPEGRKLPFADVRITAAVNGKIADSWLAP